MRTGNFDSVAPFYDALAGVVFGGALRRAQAWVVQQGLPRDARRILFIGGGTGWVLPAVLGRAPGAQVLYVEASAAMLTRARAHLTDAAPTDMARVTFQLGTEADLPADASFDAVLTFFFLDLFAPAELPAVLTRLSSVVAPAATWLVADFAPPRTAWQRGLLAVMYCFFRLTTGMQNQMLPDWPAALTQADWAPVAETPWVGGAVQAGVWRRA